jgi:DNA-binding CsgD family transcriptional regulator/tetratricopeptide (TPR) repeat protein
LIAGAEMDGSLDAAFRWKLGYVARLRGDYERAQELVEDSLAFSREVDDKFGIADVLIELGAVSAFLGDHERAREYTEEGIALCRELGYGLQLANLLGNLGLMSLLEGDYERGVALNEEAAALSRERGYKGGIAFSLDMQGWVALLQGDHERARISYRESLTLCKELGDKMVAVGSLDGLACISAAEGASERAARLFGAARVLGEAVGPLTPEEVALRAPYFVMARSQLDEASWRAAWAQGRAMSMDQAIDYALSEEKPTSPISPAPERPSADEAPHLTRREREVAALVARGFTSRQIASKLVVSERTVDNHVANILKKLSLHSREQIAARMAEQSP